MQVAYLFGGLLIIAVVATLFNSEAWADWVKSIFLFIILISGSSINFILLLFVSFLLVHHRGTLYLGNIFILLGILVIASGIMLYWGLRIFHRFDKFHETILTLMEYYIQWSLIYVTIYQTIFANIKRITDFTAVIKVGKILDPNIFIALILPSFISVWIAIIMYKKHYHLIWLVLQLKNKNFPKSIEEVFNKVNFIEQYNHRQQ